MKDQSKTKQILIQELASLRQKNAELEQSDSNLKYAEEKYRNIIENAVEGIFQTTPEGRYMSVNPALVRMFGYDSAEDMMSSVVDIGRQLYVNKEQRKEYLRLLDEKRAVENYESQMYRKDGSIIWVSINTRTVRDDAGNLLHYEGFVTDITERKQAEKEIQNLARFPSENPNPVLRIARDGTLLYINQAGLNLLPEWHLQVGHTAPPMLSEAALQTMADGSTQMLYLEHGHRVFSFTVGPVVAAGYANLYGNDITERKRAEEALRQEKIFAESLIQTAQTIVLVLDTTGCIVSFNPYMEEISGYPLKEVQGKDWFSTFLPEQDRDKIRQLYLKAISDIQTRGNINPIITKDGKERYIEWYDKTLKDLEGKVVGLLSIGQDITDRKQAEDVLREREERLRQERDRLELIMKTAQDGFWLVDASTGHLVDVNEASSSMLGYSREELLLRGLADIDAQWSPKEIRREIQKVRTAGNAFFETRHRTKGGQIIDVEISVNYMPTTDQFFSFIRNITERKKSEEDLKETLKSLRKAVGTTIQVMISAIEVRDPYTAGHQIRSSDLARAIATEMGLSQEKINGIRMAGSIHDIGKLSIPSEILSKPAKLSEIEFSLIKEHSRSGYEMLKDVESPWPLAEIVYQHHERMDGSGYPRNLKGDDILIEARIMAVADVVESMSSHRPYRPALGNNAALEELEKNRGTLYDTDVVDACLRLFRERGYQFEKG